MNKTEIRNQPLNDDYKVSKSIANNNFTNICDAINNLQSGLKELDKRKAGNNQVNSDWDATSGVAEILNKPTIPAAQVNSDWDATSGVAQILNKPTGLTDTITFVEGY